VKRWIVVALIVLAVVVLVSPGIVGRLAERNIEENIEWADDESPNVSVTTERFDRGWFTSEGRHRVVLEGGSFRNAIDVYTASNSHPDLPALIITTRIDHGLVPLSSLSRDSGSIKPGLASTVSTFQFDPGNGELLEVPGTLYSKVGLAGTTESRFVLEAGSLAHEHLSAEWQGANLTFSTNPSSGAFGIDGNTEPFSISENNEVVHFGAITVGLEQVRSDYGFNVGKIEMQMGGLQVDSAQSPFGIASMSLEAKNDMRDERMNAHSLFSLAEVTIPGFGSLDLATDLTVLGLDAASLQVVTTAIREAQAAADPELAMQLLYPGIEGDVQKLVAAGGKLRFDQFDVTLPQGKLETSMDIQFAELADDVAFSWAAVLLAMTATIDVKMPAELYEFAQMMSPEAGSLVALGILKRDGDHYVMAAEYAQGLLNVNGAPMPVPMPGM
jgi:uncharacterized protein YdgA (DUF945 family)